MLTASMAILRRQVDDLSFLKNAVQMEVEDYGYGDFIQSVDTVIMGRRTCDWVLEQGAVQQADKITT